MKQKIKTQILDRKSRILIGQKECNQSKLDWIT